MIALEAALLLVTAGASATSVADPTAEATKQAEQELLEFLGDWAPEEIRLIDDYRLPAAKPPKAEPAAGGDATDDAAE